MANFMGLRGRSLEYALIWAVILPSYVLFGYNHAVAGSLLSLPSWVETFPSIDTVNTSGETKVVNARVQGTVVSIYTLGCFFGSLNCIWLGDKLGRKRIILLGAAGNIVGAIISATAFDVPQLAIGRLVTGIGFGHLTAAAPNWQAECAKAEHRGAAVLLEGVFISLGLAIAAWVDLAMSYTTGSVSWRFPLALSAFFSIIVLITMPHMPDSPRWLVSKDRVAEARTVLAALADIDDEAPEISAEIRDIEKSLALVGQARFCDVFKNGELRLFQRATLAAAGQMFQQVSGIGALAFYQATIFEDDLGLSALQARLISGAVFTFQFLCSPLGPLTVDRFGRRRLMMFSAVGMGVCMAVMGAGASMPDNTGAVAAATTFIFLFSFFFPIGFLGLTFLYAAEIAPLSYRTYITSISTGSAWLFNFLVAEVTPIGFASIKWRYFIVYAAINFFLILPGVYFFFPETNGRALEEVDEIFIRSTSVFDTVRVANRIPRRARQGGDSTAVEMGIEVEKDNHSGSEDTN